MSDGPKTVKPVFGLSPMMLGGPISGPGIEASRLDQMPLRFIAGGKEVVRIEPDGTVFWKGTVVQEADDMTFRALMKDLHRVMCS